MIVLKMMSSEDLADSHPSKGFALLTVQDFAHVCFERAESGLPHVRVTSPDGNQDTFSPAGNTYVMENGKTIATFAHMPPH